MSLIEIPLESIRVASPCRADWDKMQGDDKARFCQSCAKNVYNLSAMSHKEAEALVQEKEGKLCVRFYERADGTVLTDDCPVGIKRLRRAALRPVAWLAAGAAALAAWGMALFGVHPALASGSNEPVCVLKGNVAPIMGAAPMMGDVSPPLMGEAMPVPTPTAKPKPSVRMGRISPSRKTVRSKTTKKATKRPGRLKKR